MARLNAAALVAVLALALLLGGDGRGPCPAGAQGGCTAECRAAFGECYKATNNRSACEAQMQRCMQGCIASKRN
jgi:hypothetical protein